MNLSDLSSLATLLTFAIALLAAVLSVPFVAREFIAWRIVRGKRRIVKLLATFPEVRNGRAIRGSLWVQARSITRGDNYAAADELQWLSQGLGAPTTFTFATLDAAKVRALGEHYRSFAAKLTVRTFLLGGSQPIFEHVAGVAAQTAAVLDDKANRHAVRKDTGRGIRVADVHLLTGYKSANGSELDAIPSQIRIHQLMVSNKTVAVELAVSWYKERIKHPEEEAAGMVHGREYDGYLPSLRERRFERDRSTGNYSLHVELGGVSYSQHKKESRIAGDVPPLGTISAPRLLTLATLPITSDGFLIFAQRGDTPYYPRCWGPGAGGNLEIPRGDGRNSDLDSRGVIDPLRAAAREAQEELGVELSHERVSSLALVRIGNAEEYGTWLLATSAFTGLTVEGIAAATIEASLVDGRWEVGEKLAAVPVPRERPEVLALLSWALRNANVMPHLAAVLVAFFGEAEHAATHGIPESDSDSNALPPNALEFTFGEHLPQQVADVVGRGVRGG